MAFHMTSRPRPNWSPFLVNNAVLIAPRPLFSIEGVGDRLRTAAFAEVQAEAAFRWAAATFQDAPPRLAESWLRLADEERRHRDWLVARMAELKIAIEERPVSDALWSSLIACRDAREFCAYIADAEERGRRAGERFCAKLKEYDSVSAEIFGKIAFEERAHINLADEFFLNQS